jgi:hypothetical protein
MSDLGVIPMAVDPMPVPVPVPVVPVPVPVVLVAAVKLVDGAAVLSGGGATVWPTNHYVSTNADAYFGILTTRMEEVTLEVSKTRQYLIVKVSSPITCQEMADITFTQKVIGGVAQHGGDFLVLVKKNRNVVCRASRFPGAVIYGFVLIPGISKESKAEGMKMFRDFLRTGETVHANFVVELGAVEVPISSEVILATVESMYERTRGMEPLEFETAFMCANSVKADSRTFQQACLVMNYAHLKIMRKEWEQSLTANAQMCRPAFGEQIPFKDFAALRELVVWGVDMDTWQVSRGSVLDFVRQGLFNQFSLILLGPPKMGKTPAAESLAAMLAKGLQDGDENPYYIKVGTVESLKAVSRKFVSGVPVIFDDITPGSDKGARAGMQWNDLKHLTNITQKGQGSENLDARNSDITIPEQCPRIFTSNARTVSDWMPGMIDVSSFDPAGVRATFANDANRECAVIYKRCVFVYINSCIVPEAMRRMYSGSSNGEAAAKVARFI